MTVFVHSSAVIDQGASIGDGCKIWHFTHVCSTAVIGRNVSLGQNVFVADRVRVGDGCRVQNNVSLYEGVELEEDVFCGPSAVFTNVHNPRAAVARKSEYRRTLVHKGATLGANCTIVCGVTIGSYAFIGAGAVVTRNVPDFALMTGVPARHTGWMSAHGERLALPVHGTGSVVCPGTGEEYVLADGVLLRQKDAP